MSDETQELRGRSAKELGVIIEEKKEELMKLRFQHSTGQLENTARLRAVKKEIAQAFTVRTEKESERS